LTVPLAATQALVADARAATQQPGAVAQPHNQAVRDGLSWLAKHQDEDGRWDADDFMKHDQAKPCTGRGSPMHDIGVTGLAMLAMLADGSTLREGPYKDNLVRAARWFRQQQDADGRIGASAAHDFIYDHAIATYAMSEAYGLSTYKLIKQSTQSAVNYLESHRNPYSVWRYQPRDGDNDISVTAWCLLACTSARSWGLKVNEQALKLGANYLDLVATPDGRHGYMKGGERSARMPGKHAKDFPVDKSEALTAAGLYCRLLLGQDPAEQAIIHRAADLLVAQPPKWSATEGTIDLYYWFYGTAAMSRLGGDRMATWNQHLGAAVASNQRRRGNARGSWDPIGVWGNVGGRVASTALAVLALQSCQRTSRLIRSGQERSR